MQRIKIFANESKNTNHANWASLPVGMKNTLPFDRLRSFVLSAATFLATCSVQSESIPTAFHQIKDAAASQDPQSPTGREQNAESQPIATPMETGDEATKTTNRSSVTQNKVSALPPQTTSPENNSAPSENGVTDTITPVGDALTKKSPAEKMQDELDYPADLLVIVGAGGTTEYQQDFLHWESQWRELAESSGARYRSIGSGEPTQSQKTQLTDRELLSVHLDELLKPTDIPLWIILIGHGTFTRGVAKFNLRGPDISAEELNKELTSSTRPTIILNFSSASGPFINTLSKQNRVILTATRSGQEQNYSRFGGYFIESLRDPKADLDHDHQVSLLEAFLSATSRTQSYYDSEQRMMTEHALIDDNGDQLGTPANFFRGIRAVKKPKNGTLPDGRKSARQTLTQKNLVNQLTPEQRKQRDRYEDSLDEIIKRQSTLSEAQYLLELEAVLIPLSKLYEEPTDTEEDTKSEN